MNSLAWASCSLVRNERALHSMMAILLVAIVIGNVFLRRSIAQNIEQITAEADDCASLCEIEDSLLATVETTKRRKDNLDQAYRSTLARIPKNVADSEVLSSVRMVISKSHCSLIDFRPATTIDRKEFQNRSYDLQLEGSFKHLVQFFDLLQKAPFVFQVARFKITEPSAPGSACKAEMELRTVFDHVWASQGATSE